MNISLQKKTAARMAAVQCLYTLAVTGEARTPLLPDVPTLKESGIDAEVVGWNSLVAPAGTPKETIAILSGHIGAIIGSPDFKQRMIDLGGEPKASTPEELDARLKADIVMWAAVVRKAGLEPH